MKSPLYILLFLAALGCKRPGGSDGINFMCAQTGAKDIRNVHFKLDSVLLDSMSSSYVGESCIQNNNIYFIDEKFCYTYKFDLKGKLIHQYVGQGMGANQLPIKTILLFSPLKAGGFVFIGASWDVFVYDSNFKRVDDYGINWHNKVTKEAMLKKPDPSQGQLYSVIAMHGEIRSAGQEIFLPIASQHPTFNPTNPAYFKEGRNMALMDLENGYIEKIYGGFPPVYSNNSGARTFPYHYLALSADNTFEMAYPPDSLIYKSDRDLNMLKRFGFAGRDMDTNYHSVADIEKFRENYIQTAATKGYYTGLEYIPEGDLTFRTYQKGGHEESDGLQIYKADTLIADLDVPKGLRVDGYSAPWFYSNAFVDEDKGEIKLYKFRID